MQTAKLSTQQHRGLTLSLYLNYLVHGFSLIIIAQNMTNLSNTFSTTIAQISFIASGTGIGRLIGYLLTAYFSDRYSRKTVIVTGMFCYLIFAWGVLLAPNLTVLYALTMLTGIGNSCLDAGTYTTLVEINNGEGYATILIKGFMSIGEFILPLIISGLQQAKLWYGWSFVIMGVLMLINLFILLPVKFPDTKVETQEEVQKIAGLSKSKNTLATCLLGIYGYASMALMIWFTQWITLYSKQVLHYSDWASHGLMSAYSLGSMVGVIALYILSKKRISNTKLLIACNVVALAALAIALLSKNVYVVGVSSLVFGASCAGGVMQIGLTVLMNLHPLHRGLMTSLYYLFGSFASISVPLISGQFSKISLRLALGSDLAIAVLATVLVCAISLILQPKRNRV